MSNLRLFDRRNHFNIMAAILSLCRRKLIQKTRIMYLCNLSYDQLQRYIELLTRLGLLEVIVESDKEYYRTTERGKEFLDVFQKLETFLSEDLNRI